MLLVLLACADPDAPGESKPTAPDDTGPDDTGAPDSGDSGDSGDTADPGPSWQILPASCEPPGTLPLDPLLLEGQARVEQEEGSPFLEALDVQLIGNVAWVVGQGGLLAFDVGDPSAPVLLTEPTMDRYHRVEPLADGVIATSHTERGAFFWDGTDPTALTGLGFLPVPGLEGMAYAGGRLWVAVRGEGVRAYDVSDPASPAEVARAAGLAAPWELAATGDGWLYAADNSLGVVPIDIRVPESPIVGAPIPLDGAALHVRYADDRLYVASGGAGVAIFDVTERATPTLLYTVATGGSAVMTDVSEGRLWVVDHEGVSVLALGDGPPTPIQRDTTEQFALAVDAEGPRAFVGDWNLFESWLLVPDVEAGALDAPSDVVRYTDTVTTVELTNRGSGVLTLTGATIGDAAVLVEVSATTLAPGETATLRLTGVVDDTDLCLASDDPDAPVRTFAVRSSAEAPAGVPAPDFALQDLDGNVHRLSEQLGNPVLLSYFATW